MWQATAIIAAAFIIVTGARQINQDNNAADVKQTAYEVCAGLEPADRIACIKEVR
jgi:hypothetical protein